jgi:DMSO/TMAO reductase YedYZ heme-binding membrane subunit
VNVLALNSQVWWWIARSTGLVAWCVVTAGIVWGLTLASKVVRRRKVPAWLLDLHRYLGTLSLLFVAAHLVALSADDYVGFSAGDLFVPMAAAWRPVAVAWGIVAFYLLLLVQLTSWTMRWLPRRLWHSIHLLSFAVLAAGTVHGVTAGADAGEPTLQFGLLAGITVVLTLAIFRMLNKANEASPARVESQRVEPPAADPALAERLSRLGSRVRSSSVRAS